MVYTRPLPFITLIYMVVVALESVSEWNDPLNACDQKRQGTKIMDLLMTVDTIGGRVDFFEVRNMFFLVW